MTKRIYTAGVYAERDMMLRLARRHDIADGVVCLEFVRADGGPMPPWEPGAHMEIDVPGIGIRHYSLIGDPRDRSRWQVAVRLVEHGEASRHLHTQAAVGDEFHVIAPRNHFRFTAPPGAPVCFIAGGIGITPLMSMLKEAEAAGCEWSLVYFGRSRATMPFLDELSAHGERVRAITSPERTPGEVSALISGASAESVIYTCGPEPLIDEAARASAERGLDHRCEHFALSGDTGLREDDRPFDLVCAARGQTVRVGADETIVMALRREGIEVRTSCEMGVCGTCETRVLAGQPDHRDSLLSQEERDDGDCMMICVGRARGDELTVEL